MEPYQKSAETAVFLKHLCYTEKHSQFLTDLEKSAVVTVVQWAKYYS